MSRGAISILFSKECTEDERNALLLRFESLNRGTIERNNVIEGYIYRIVDILEILNNNKPSIDVAVQTDGAERPASPSVFQNIENQSELYKN